MNSPAAVRYAKSIKLHVMMQPKQPDGLINPPYLEISYDSVTYDDYQNGNNITVIASTFCSNYCAPGSYHIHIK